MIQLFCLFRNKWMQIVGQLLDSQEFIAQDNEKLIALSRLQLKSQTDYRYILLKNDEHIYEIYTKGEITKPHIVLLHGFGATSLNNIRVLQHLFESFQVHVIDMPGVGLSSREGWNDEFTQQETVNYFIDSMQEWREKVRIEKFVLLGHSFGGYISSLYFQRYPERVSQLILVSPAGTSILTDEQFKQKTSGLGKQLKYFLGQKIFKMEIKPSRIMNTPIIGRLVYKLLFDQTRVSPCERPICIKYLKHVNKLQKSSELGFYKLFQWPLKPKKSIEQILIETNQRFPIPIHFYYGDQDYMPSEGAYRLQNNFENITVDIIDDSGHQVLFQNPAQLSQKILLNFINPQSNYFQKRYYDTIKQIAEDYAKPNDLKAFKAFSLSILLFVLSTYFTYNVSQFIGSFFLILTIVRIFIQFHDMAHQSFFQSFSLNYAIGKIIGVLTHYPYDQWKSRHNDHHFKSGNLDEKDPQSSLLTKDQYSQSSTLQKMGIRLLRQPIIFYVATSQIFWVFLVLYQIIKEKGWRSSAFFQKILSFVLYFYILDISWYLRLHCALIIGHLLFHFQHTVNQPYAKHKNEWNHQRASIEGSTFLQIPSVLKYFTNGIQYHHIHHLNTRVASYSIQQCHDFCSNKIDWRKLNLKKVDLKICLSNLTNVLYDQSQNRFTPFPPLF